MFYSWLSRRGPRQAIATVIAALIGSLLCGATEIQDRNSNGQFSEFPETTWAKFVSVGKDTAIFVPVEIEGIEGPCVMQLDTGANSTVLYLESDELSEATTKPQVQNRRLMVDKVDFGKRPMFINSQMARGKTGVENEPRVIGTIGLDCFSDHAWALDFVEMRFAVTPFFKGLPADARKPGIDIDLIHRNQKIFIPVSIGNEIVYDFFYDTGAHRQGILTDEEPWNELTGRKSTDSANTRESAFSWGKPIEIVSARCNQGVRIGDYKMENVNASFTKDPPENLLFAGYPFKAKGLIGNAPFLGKAIVIIEVRDNFMRIIRKD